MVAGDRPAKALAKMGAVPRSVDAVSGELRIVADIPPQYTGEHVPAGFLEEYPDAELLDSLEQSNFALLAPEGDSTAPSGRGSRPASGRSLTSHSAASTTRGRTRSPGGLAETLETDAETVGGILWSRSENLTAGIRLRGADRRYRLFRRSPRRVGTPTI
jgi:hypothetical protein